jgi:hypothetical protein
VSDFTREEWLARRTSQPRRGKYLFVSTSQPDKNGMRRVATMNIGRNAAKRQKRAKQCKQK